jgi:hypothetical protein
MRKGSRPGSGSAAVGAEENRWAKKRCQEYSVENRVRAAFFAPKGRNNKAQGNALGLGT